MARTKTGGLEQSLTHLHQFGAEVAEELVSLGVCMHVFLGEVSKSLLQESFLLFKQPRHFCADLAYPMVVHFHALSTQ
jgi:hypothetical protein